jgi:ribonuclease J
MEQANRLPDHEVCICCTGAQGERYAAMMRMATGEHKDTTLRATDTVVFSSSVIPGNERAVQLIFDIIMAQGPTIKHYRESEIHAGGHARQEDTEKMIKLIRPEVYVPIYGYPHMLHGNAKNAYKLGYDHDHVLITRNGQIMEFTKDSFQLTHMFASHEIKSVDGYTLGYTNETHLHDRYQLELNGCVAVSFAPIGKGWSYRYDVTGLPAFHVFPTLEKRLKEFLAGPALDTIEREKDLKRAKAFISKKVGDIIFDEIGKEPVVMTLIN